MVLTCLKLQAAPFQDGFPASRQVPRGVSGNHFVANSKKDSCSGLNTIPKLLVTLAVILALHLQPRTDCPFPNTLPLPSATPLRTNPMTICLMSWASSRMGLSLSLKQAWRTTNDRIATLPKLRQLAVLHAFNRGPTGLPRKRHSPEHAITIWFSCMLDARRFPLLLTLRLPSRRFGPGEKLPVSKRSSKGSLGGGLSHWLKRRSGRSLLMLRQEDICWLIWNSRRLIVSSLWPYFRQTQRRFPLTLFQIRSFPRRGAFRPHPFSLK